LMQIMPLRNGKACYSTSVTLRWQPVANCS